MIAFTEWLQQHTHLSPAQWRVLHVTSDGPSHALNTNHISHYFRPKLSVFSQRPRGLLWKPHTEVPHTTFQETWVKRSPNFPMHKVSALYYSPLNKLHWLVTPLRLKHYVSFHLCSQVHEASKHQEKNLLPWKPLRSWLDVCNAHMCPSFVSPAASDSTQTVVLASVSTNAHSYHQPYSVLCV